MITNPKGDGVILIGGWNIQAGTVSNAILEFKDGNWIKLNETLKFGRQYPLAFPVPLDLTNCGKIRKVSLIFPYFHTFLDFLGKCYSKVEVKATEESKSAFDPNIFGTYTQSLEKVNGKSLFVSQAKNNKTSVPLYGVWWSCGDRWCINSMFLKGQCNCVAFNAKSPKCLSWINDWDWVIYNGTVGTWMNGGRNFGVQKSRGEITVPKFIV